MGKPYSLDLRERICAYVAEGNSARSAGRLFGVSAATAVRLAAKHREHGTAVPKPISLYFFRNKNHSHYACRVRYRASPS